MYRIDRIFLSPSVRQSVSGVVRHACHELAGVNMDVQDGGDFCPHPSPLPGGEGTLDSSADKMDCITASMSPNTSLFQNLSTR